MQNGVQEAGEVQARDLLGVEGEDVARRNDGGHFANDLCDGGGAHTERVEDDHGRGCSKRAKPLVEVLPLINDWGSNLAKNIGSK